MLVEVMRFNRNVTKFLEGGMEPESGLSVQDLFFLFYLSKKRRATYYKLTLDLPYNPSYISRVINRLEKLEFIKRENEKNKKIIEITPKGETILKKNHSGRDRFIESMVDRGMTIEELGIFFEIMHKFSNALEEELGERLVIQEYLK